MMMGATGIMISMYYQKEILKKMSLKKIAQNNQINYKVFFSRNEVILHWKSIYLIYHNVILIEKYVNISVGAS